MKKEIISFRKDINPLEVVTLSERIKDMGYIEEVRVRFYAGIERSLKVRPYVLHDDRKIEDLFTYAEGTEVYLTGEDDYFIFPVSARVFNDDTMNVWVENTNADYVYTVVVDIVISYGYEEGEL